MNFLITFFNFWKFENMFESQQLTELKLHFNLAKNFASFFLLMKSADKIHK